MIGNPSKPKTVNMRTVTQKDVKWIPAKKDSNGKVVRRGFLALRSNPSKPYTGRVSGVKRGSTAAGADGVAVYSGGRNVGAQRNRIAKKVVGSGSERRTQSSEYKKSLTSSTVSSARSTGLRSSTSGTVTSGRAAGGRSSTSGTVTSARSAGLRSSVSGTVSSAKSSMSAKRGPYEEKKASSKRSSTPSRSYVGKARRMGY